jgi:hypothetical protein
MCCLSPQMFVLLVRGLFVVLCGAPIGTRGERWPERMTLGKPDLKLD